MDMQVSDASLIEARRQGSAVLFARQHLRNRFWGTLRVRNGMDSKNLVNLQLELKLP